MRRSPPSPVILLLTHSRDVFVIDRVIEALAEQGARPVRFDTDRFPLDLGLSVVDDGHPSDSRVRSLIDLPDGETLDASDVQAVWTRSLWPANLDEAGSEPLDPRHRAACQSQIREARDGFLHGLSHARWINDYHAMGRASNKVFQHQLAAAAGLRVPRTLITNRPERVRTFWHDLEGRVVTKLLAGLTFGMNRQAGTFHTSEVTEEHLEPLEDELRYSPMIFQENVEKDCELRVMYVAGEVFPGAIRAAGTRGETDWRQAAVAEVAWEPAELPAEVVNGLRRFMAAVGLEQGAFDLIRRPDGEHVFLEVNPTGEWGMLERDLDLPISRAVADALLAPPG